MSRRVPWDLSARPPHTKLRRVAPLNRSHPATAMMPTIPVAGTWVPPQADRSKSVDVDEAQRGRCAPAPCAAAAGRPPLRDEPDRHRPVLPHDAVGLVLGLAQSRLAVTSRAEVDRRRLGAQVKAHGAHGPPVGRTRPTARAGRCAAACGRSAAASRSTPRTAVARPSAAPSTTCAMRRRPRIDDVEHATPPSVPGVERLAAGRGIERRAVEDHLEAIAAGPPAARRRRVTVGVELAR